MTLRLRAVVFDAEDPSELARFWAGLLEVDGARDGDGGWSVPGTATRVGLRFLPGPGAPHDARRLHLHLTSQTPADQQHTVARALRAGGHHLDIGQRPEEGHVVLADPEGNAFCVIEAGNAYLAGCGFLGEVACDGTREVGLFWSAALGWPLVWEEGEETAVQSPEGGTKVAWGGRPVAPKRGRNPQWFELATAGPDRLEAETDRLLRLGATRPGGPHPAAGRAGEPVELADPDGNEFVLRSG